MNSTITELDAFQGRKAALEQIGRFHIYSPMFYRPTVYFHSLKVACLITKAAPLIEQFFDKSFDTTKAITMALVHDDAEIITGDVQAGHKAKMGRAVLQQVDLDEVDAINELASQFPQEIHNYNYRSLLMEVMHKNTLESQVVKFFDRFDALCESLHELYAGNSAFTINVSDAVLGKIDIPHDYYIKHFNKRHTHYPLLQVLVSETAPFLEKYMLPPATELVRGGKLHTAETLYKNTGNEVYDWWKMALRTYLDKEYIERLYIKKENILE
ncbi:MAG: YfbR-like 5'-deoxynucleotidase [Patescibacteria group bacterium UBA2163]